MYKKNIFFALLVGICSLSATTFEWGSANSSGSTTDPTNNVWDGADVGWFMDSSAYPAFDTETLAISLDGTSTTNQAGLFKPAVGDKLMIKKSVKIKGDVEIRFTGTAPDGNGNITHEIFEIDIGNFDDEGVLLDTDPINIAAFNDAATTTNDAAQLVFNVAQGKTMVINMYTDLNFHSVDALESYDPGTVNTGAPLPLNVSFRGQGSIIFRMPSGKRLYFGPPNPGKAAEGTDPADDPLSTRGVHVHVLMSQSSLDMFGGSKDNGDPIAARSLLTFEKWSYGEESGADAVNTATILDTWITFGQKSSFVFLSDNYQGISEKWLDAVSVDNDIDLGEPIIRPGYGSVAFDPSNAGTGRMILEIARGQKPSGNDFTDAGFGLYGALVVPTMFGSDRQASVILNSNLRSGVYYNQRAGIRALMRIVDDVAYYERTALESSMSAEDWAKRITLGHSTEQLTAEQWVARPEGDRRGLVIINHNNTIPHFANNYDGALSIDANRWARYNNYQPGFVLGVNGELEIRSHLFLDYYANNVGKSIERGETHLDHAPDASTHSTAVVKNHNPAAFFVDTLPSYTKRTQYGLDQFDIPISDVLFLGHGPAFGTQARMQLEGNAAVYFRAVAPFNSGAVTKSMFVQPKHNGLYHLQEVDGTDVITVPLGIGQYDGSMVPILDSNNAFVMQSLAPEGEHALDLEGPLTITGVAGSLGEPAAAELNIPSVELNHAGQEIGYTNFDLWTTWQQWLVAYPGKEETTVQLPDGSYVLFNADTNVVLTQAALAQRPLNINQWFTTYNVSSILANAQLTLNSVTWNHNDATRDMRVPEVLPYPLAQARPHVVGGELGDIKGLLDTPVIALNDSTIACHESLVTAGVAMTVTDQLPLAVDQPTTANNASKIICYNRGRDYDVNGYGRVVQFGSKGNTAADGITSSELLNSGYIDVYRAGPTTGATTEAPTLIRLQLTAAQEPGVAATEAGLHTLYLANESQVRLGWPTLEADSGYTPLSLNDTILTRLVADDPSNKNGFRFNPYTTGVGELQFAGGPFLIRAADSLDIAPPDRPIAGVDVGGVIYVNHGGKMSITDTNDLFIDTTIAKRISNQAASMGQVGLPRDQVYYLYNGAVQSYDIDFTADKALTGVNAGHVLLGANDPIHLFNVQQSYPDEAFDQVK